MKIRTLFVINTIVALPFGIGSVLVPKLFLSIFGATLGPAGALMMQFGGAWLIGIGLLTWFMRSVAQREVQRSIVLALLVMYVLGFAVALLGQLAGVLNALGWFVVAINALLALGLGVALFSRPEARDATPLAQRG